ncbi:MAG: extracellular solute-binding protein, partial [Pirellulaceae bacterium]|nr:extracellular solute-binding protein [Pirellulaceae bacterium]
KLESAELGDPRRKRLAADAVIYPSGLIGELAERGWIVPLSDDSIGSPEFARRDIFDLLRQHEIMWGDQVYAVPLGSPALTLIYRPDMFEKLGVKPPESWQQYGERCAQLARSRDLLVGSENGPGDWHAVAEPLGPGWASQVLLARAAAYARHRSYFATLFDLQSMEPLIASPPFVKALEELVAQVRRSGLDQAHARGCLEVARLRALRDGLDVAQRRRGGNGEFASSRTAGCGRIAGLGASLPRRRQPVANA